MNRFSFGVFVVLISVFFSAQTCSADGAALAPMRIRDCMSCPQLVIVEAGEFVMGTPPGGYEAIENTGESPSVRIVVPSRFAIGETEVTREEYARFVSVSGYQPTGKCRVWRNGRWTVGAGADWTKPEQPRRPARSHPVSCISWNDAVAYAAWLSEQTDKVYRLPSEAEWEYAARGGVAAPRWWGWNSFEAVSISEACKHANVYDIGSVKYFEFPWPHARCDDGFINAAPVKSFDANPYGLFDIIGNVWEWTEDCYTGSYVNRAKDSRAWVWDGGCETRIIRGGSWAARPLHNRSANRGNKSPDYSSSDVGFRVVREIAPDELFQ